MTNPETIAETETAAAPDAPAEDARPEPGGVALWKPSLAVFAATLIIDHASKFWAKGTLEPMLASAGDRAIGVIPGLFELRYGENTGAAFSILSGHTEVLGIISLVAVFGLGWWWRSMPAGEWAGRLAVAGIVGGAVGNMIDRFSRGYVVDMFHAFYGEYSWPIFNVADSMICVGMAVLMWRVWKGQI